MTPMRGGFALGCAAAVPALIAASAVAALAGELARPLPAPPDVPDPSRPCIRHEKDGLREPEDLDALLDCQSGFRRAWIGRYERKAGIQPPSKALDRFDDFQRAEVRDYLSRHPDRAHTGAADEEDDVPERAARRPAGRPKGGSARRRCAPGQGRWAKASPEDKELSEQWARTTEAVDKDMEGRDPALRQDLRALGNELMKSSDGGRKGITPAGAKLVLGFLRCEQGGASPDMARLLNSVSEDGASLKPATMLQLKRAAREAKGRGLDLGVDEPLERWLIDLATDPDVAVDDLVPN